ncbi:MAG: nicotinate (nicotinamide) nucleotide adenylyltransferase [Lachnospiraceae bacterium]|nr:nicotinate (nicotinamide) nucleotide adenylyltransferase [Prevotella sp.]MCM1075177.1 nicotinate (nicotinamide) nucleotide adenylyltransferase [Ruminococcus sp.]MCM1223214.1 nicotinate (nicotinamide) nucleotide adenylyltransferase [Lachnospiraceae bacterium]
MNILVYSGSFNPLHIGHAMLCSWVSQYCPEIDELWLTVTPQNPLKEKASEVTDANRLEAVGLLSRTIPGVSVCDFEFSLPKPTYTYATLRAMAHKWPWYTFKLLIGSDNWLIFDKWKNYRQIIDEFGVYIYLRPGYSVDNETLPPSVKLLEGAPQTDISSTFIRNGFRRGDDMRYFLPEPVYNYIKENNLYGK